MSDNTFYKPLTPHLRDRINCSIDRNIEELKTCQSNALVNMQISGQVALKNLIKSLPDGYPIPTERKA